MNKNICNLLNSCDFAKQHAKYMIGIAKLTRGGSLLIWVHKEFLKWKSVTAFLEMYTLGHNY